jgi:dolichyl-phosphate-mannose--protein O-mannosyl transferase
MDIKQIGYRTLSFYLLMLILVIVDLNYISDTKIILINMIVLIIISYLYTQLISDMQMLK